ncbi:MAG: hypothetical protein P8Z49_12410 [Acidobacteriota bacterium]
MTDFFPDPDHFSSLPDSLGSESVTVALQDIAVRFDGLSPALALAARKRYALFLSDATPLHRVVLHPGGPAYLEPATDRFLRLEERIFPEGRVLSSTDFTAYWEEGGAGRGVLRVSSPDDGKAVERAMENYLRWVVSDLAIERGAFILHAAGLLRNSRAYLFFGHSGAGKSTVTALSEGCQVLSDDLVLLVKTDEGFKATTTPFWGTFPQSAKDTGLYPVAGLFRLRQSKDVKTTPVSGALAILARTRVASHVWLVSGVKRVSVTEVPAGPTMRLTTRSTGRPS